MYFFQPSTPKSLQSTSPDLWEQSCPPHGGNRPLHVHLNVLGDLLATVLKELFDTEGKAQGAMERELREPEGFSR